jgi:thiamine-phosphate pyrophosphorylase
MLSPTAARILDANANRAREALRVLEDYARFALDNQAASAGLKAIRHDLAGVLGPHLPGAILHRDTAGDVGTANKTATELQRQDLAHVVLAAGKRLGEALRVLEEILKTVDPAAASAVEKLRYRFYVLEQGLVRTLGRGGRFAGVRLYVLVTESLCRKPWVTAAEEAIRGGADCLQLREKQLESGELLRRARQLSELCRAHGVLCIINDRPDIALLAGADGVHVGQEDLPAIEARKIVGPDKIVGVSTHSLAQARQAALDGADYLGVGPVFPSSTKPRDILPGLDYARAAAGQTHLPCVAIAGITQDNVGQVLATGVSAIAVTAAVMSQDDVAGAAAALKRVINQYGAAGTILAMAQYP